ncbi:Mitochondrial inner membrane translocase subunit Tim17/Tim22/Tim23/peroxisomal protein PMP24 [Medicago truncatula]|uniref:Mitochondrial inner membrane translocase subunit Tim17/Tim22/Tim23/peroxisomal protein PMP24 n=1 Tax=Medicago truncatula TaxID=3880 RepID=A0A396IFY4_MEDTR|nr:Mitochondrial inner membrane translocase subunit Tim17/Tim22/Tim23/peroxisomal protein PMP24 [Medicago truncatula]
MKIYILHQPCEFLSSSYHVDPFFFSFQARAKHDITNTFVAGCTTGAAISAKGGPQAACMGCAGFAAFSVVIEKFLERHQ